MSIVQIIEEGLVILIILVSGKPRMPTKELLQIGNKAWNLNTLVFNNHKLVLCYDISRI